MFGASESEKEARRLRVNGQGKQSNLSSTGRALIAFVRGGDVLTWDWIGNRPSSLTRSLRCALPDSRPKVNSESL